MTVDPTKVAFSSSYNAFKNVSVQRGTVPMPGSLIANEQYSATVTFTLSESANFIQAYTEGTDYGDYFLYLDGEYHDSWLQIKPNNDYLVFMDDAGVNTLQFYRLEISIAGDDVTVIYSQFNTSFPVTLNHPTGLVPVTFIEYNLAQ